MSVDGFKLSDAELPAHLQVVNRDDGQGIKCRECGATAGLRPLGDCECGGDDDD